MRENADQNNSKHGHFLRSGMFTLGIVPLMEYDVAGLTLRCLGGPAKKIKVRPTLTYPFQM